MAYQEDWQKKYGGKYPQYTIRVNDDAIAQFDELQKFFSDESGQTVNRAQVLRFVLDLAHRNLVKREDLKAPDPPKPRCPRCGGEAGYWHVCWEKSEPRERSQKSIQIEMEARQRFERLGMLPRSDD
jgi:hypothetical protein